MRTLGLLVAAGVLTLTTACGGGGGRPSVDELAKSLNGGKASGVLPLPKDMLDEKTTQCLAKAIVNSDLSDKAVRAIADGDKGFDGDAADTKAMAAISDELGACATAAVTH